MTLPSNATKTHLDSAGDDPKQARGELASLVDKFNDLIDHLDDSTILSTPLAIGEGLESDGSGNLRAKLNGTTLTRGSSGLAAAAASETQAGVAEIATQNEANTGTDDARMLTAKKLAEISPASVTLDVANDQALILDASDSNKLKRAAISGLALQKSYVSPDQTITLAGLVTLTHGLGAVPALISTMLVCVTGEAGYTAGDIVENPIFGPGQNNISSFGSMVRSATEIVIRYPSTNIYVANKSTGVLAAITVANWNMRVAAYV